MTDNQLIAGIMSGTSLDGLDVAFCRFAQSGSNITFSMEHAETISYDAIWKEKLRDAYDLDGVGLMNLHAEFGRFIGHQLNRIEEEKGIAASLVASHGHTVFHRPDKGFTFQMGSGAAIAAVTGIDTVCDFRTTDVALGGQGAPLVPIGDRLLFGGHRFCLNIGGIANISYEQGEEVLAFDICPANMALNLLASEADMDYDLDGKMAMEGQVNENLLSRLRALEMYRKTGPVSLGRESFDSEFKPLILDKSISLNDRMRTVCDHIAERIAAVLFKAPGTTMLTTGGGAFNGYLVEAIEEQVSKHGIHVVVPDPSIVSFKEALIFALLGWLRLREEVNTFASVTGATHNSIGGCVYLGA
ncbi:MAG: anhydro-N-acetylmuramic acid kinase [Bacteroidota bacterium]